MSRLTPIAIIVLAWMVFFWRILTPLQSDRLTFQQGDFTLQFLAYRQIGYRQIAQGHFPFIEECLYGGYPFQADPQAQILYPPVLGLMLTGDLLGWPTYPLRALEWEVMLHTLIAALAMYAFLRSMRLHRLASTLGALVYAFSGFMTGYAMLQTAILETAAWFPLIMLFLRRLATWPARTRLFRWIRDAILLALVVALAFTAGHPQTLLFIVYAGTIAFTFWAWNNHVPVTDAFMRAGAGGLLAIGLSAPQLIPSLSFMLASTRATLAFPEVSSGFAINDIVMFLLTGVTNVWQPLYLSVSALVLCGVAFTARRGEVWLWLGIAIGALILSFGANALGFDLAYIMAPGYKQFHNQERHAVIVVFALSVLTAVGMQVLLSPLRRRSRIRIMKAGRQLAWWAGMAMTLLIAIILYYHITNTQDPSSNTVSDHVAMIVIGLIGMCGLFILRARLGRIPHWLWSCLVLALAIFDLFSINRYTATQPLADPFPVLPLVVPIKNAVGFPDNQIAKSAYRVNNHYGLPLNAACVNGLNEIGGGSPIMLQTYKTFLARTPEDIYSRLLNVYYTVTWRGGMGTDNGKHIPEQKLATDSYQNVPADTFFLDWPAPAPQPVWIASNITYTQSEDELYGRLNDDRFDPMAEALLYSRDQSEVFTAAQGNAGLEGKTPGYMKIAAYATAPSLVVVSEAYHWNWIALVNGVEVRPLIVDGALLGVRVPSGNSTVELSYRPMDFYVGGGISGVTCLVVLLFLVWKPKDPQPR